MDPKEVAARRAVQYVQSGMTIGIGTGSTSAYAITALGERVHNEGLQIRAVPTSVGSREMAEALGIPLVDLSDVGQLDVTIDGADEVDQDFESDQGRRRRALARKDRGERQPRTDYHLRRQQNQALSGRASCFPSPSCRSGTRPRTAVCAN